MRTAVEVVNAEIGKCEDKLIELREEFDATDANNPRAQVIAAYQIAKEASRLEALIDLKKLLSEV